MKIQAVNVLLSCGAMPLLFGCAVFKPIKYEYTIISSDNHVMLNHDLKMYTRMGWDFVAVGSNYDKAPFIILRGPSGQVKLVQ
jgi:hypothetical protein